MTRIGWRLRAGSLAAFRPLAAALIVALMGLAPLSAAAGPLSEPSASVVANALSQDGLTVLDGAGADRDLAGVNPKDYMTTTVTVAQPSLVRVSFTGYAFAKSSAVGAQMPGCPCLVRGELRQGDGPRQIATRTVLATNASDIAGNPSATPAVAAADRRDISGSHVFSVPAGTHTFTMSLMREVGSADNVGLAFGRMAAEASPIGGASMPAMPRTGAGATADGDLSWMSVAGAGVLAAAIAIARRRRRGA